MIMNLIMSYAKNYLIKRLNSLLEKNKNNVKVICSQIDIWSSRLQIIVNQLKSISERASDGMLTDEEVDKSVEEIEQIVKDWK